MYRIWIEEQEDFFRNNGTVADFASREAAETTARSLHTDCTIERVHGEDVNVIPS